MSSPPPDTRTRILEAAWKLLTESNGRDVRMADVAAAAKLSRQAVYLHFGSRAELMIATARHGDEIHHLDERLQSFDSARSGTQKLIAFIEFWGSYIEVIHPVARALLAARETDEAAAAAWNDRMSSVRNGCRETINALQTDGLLAPQWTSAAAAEAAVDLLWAQLSIHTWEDLTHTCGWTTEQYIERTTDWARRALVKEGGE